MNTAPASAFDALLDVLLFRAGHNTAVVMRGTVVLGMACGVIGAFLVLRKRALLADAISHAALPGVCVGFMFASAAGFPGKSPMFLLPAAAAFSLLGVAAVHLLTSLPRVREDAAIGVVLSVFFALGIVLLRVIQDSSAAGQAGLHMFIFGQAATLSGRDAQVIMVASAALVAIALVFFKEFRLLCFDADFARSLGRSTALLDALLLAMVTAVTVVGISAVGAILMVALLIIPAVAARFWSHRLAWVLALSAAMGGGSCAVGTATSAAVTGVPTGPAIVIACGMLCVASMLLAPRQGILASAIHRRRLSRQIAREHLLRAMFETEEFRGGAALESSPITIDELLDLRHWSRLQVARLLRRLVNRGEATRADEGYRLTDLGRAEAARIVRAHRLWELYLVHAVDVDPSHVDRDADDVEHFLTDDLRREIERQLELVLPPGPEQDVPVSLHELGVRSGEGARA